MENKDPYHRQAPWYVLAATGGGAVQGILNYMRSKIERQGTNGVEGQYKVPIGGLEDHIRSQTTPIGGD